LSRFCVMTPDGPDQRTRRTSSRRAALASTFVATCLALALLAPASSAQLGGYSTPVDLGGVGGALIAVDPQGRATVLGAKNWRIRAVRLNAAGKPGPVRMLSRKGAEARAVQVAVDPQGRATVVWRRVDRPNGSIEAVRISAAGKPGPVRRLTAPPNQNHWAPQVAVDPQGRATVVWLKDGQRVQAVRLDAAGNPGPTQTLYQAVHHYSGVAPQVAVDPDGRATVVWRGATFDALNRVATSSIQAVRLDASGEPGLVRTLAEADGNLIRPPRIAVDRDGRTTVVWRRADGPSHLDPAGSVEAVRLDAAGEPGAIRTLSEPGDGVVAPRVAVDPDGGATVVWRRETRDPALGRVAASTVQAVRLDSGGDPGPVRTLSPPRQPRPGTAAYVALDPEGRATVVWQRADRRGSRVQAVRLDAAGDPGVVQTLTVSRDRNTFGGPLVAVDPAGRATVVWVRRETFRRPDGLFTRTRVQAAHSVRLFAVRAQPRRRTVGPGTTQVHYRFRATNMDTEPSGVVRLCAKAPSRRVKVLGKRCRVFEDIEPGAGVRRVVRVRPLGRARGKLTRIRLRARGPNVEAGTTVRLKVRR